MRFHGPTDPYHLLHGIAMIDTTGYHRGLIALSKDLRLVEHHRRGETLWLKTMAMGHHSLRHKII